MKTNLQEFISTLYHNRKVIEWLFANKPYAKFKEELTEIDNNLTDDRFKKLLDLQLVQETNQRYFLNEELIEFLNHFLEIGEVNAGKVGNILEKIRRNFIRYQESHDTNAIQKTKRLLQELRSTLLSAVILLRNKIDESYKSAQNYELKKIELNFCEQDLQQLIEGIEESKKLLAEHQAFFQSEAEMLQLTTNLKKVFLDTKAYLYEIQNQIVEYLHKIYQQDEFYKHIQKLKELKDKAANLHHVSNLAEVATQNQALFLNKNERLKSHVSLNYIFDDEGQKIVKKLREKLYENYTYQPKEKIVKNTSTEKEQIVEIDKDELFALFQDAHTHQNLFDYLLNFSFPPEIKNFDKVMRVNLFVEMVVDYSEKLIFTDQYKHIDLQNLQPLSYQIVFAKE
jgi:hypothetical protein